MGLFGEHEKTRVIEGPGCLESLGREVAALGVTRALLVSDPGVVAAGHAGRALASLAQAGVVPELFAEVQENPTTEDVTRGLAAALPLQPEAFVAIGGGSAIDVAKGVDFLFCCGGRMQDYWGPEKATRPLLPVVAVPTTAGTGSEVQSFALIGDPATHRKMACGDPTAAPRLAFLDPELTLTMPPFVTACTGLDALAHAVESAVCNRRTALSATYSNMATALLMKGLPAVLDHPTNLEARMETLQGAALAGLAIEHSMLGAAHALANPLTARYGIPHGQAVGTLLPKVIEFNAARSPWAADQYAELARLGQVEERNAAGLAQAVLDLIEKAGLPLSLGELGVQPADHEALAEGATQQWTAGFNPVAMDVGGFRELLSPAE